MNENEMLNLYELIALIEQRTGRKLGRTTVWRWTRDGIVPPPRHSAASRQLRWRKDVIEKWIEEQGK